MVKKQLKKSIISGEWRHLFKNKILLISSFVILFIPIMYGGFFLGSIWDPYGNTSNLPVVVVNKDSGAELNGEQVNLGEDIVAELKDDSNLDWNFESADQAAADMTSNKYYMQITIPENFSENVASVTTDNAQKSVIEYKVAASKNYIGTVISDEAVSQLKNSVSVKVTKAYVDAIFAQIQELSSGMSEASAGATAIYDGLSSLNSGLATFTDGLGAYTNGVGSLTTGQNQLTSGLSAASTGGAKIEAGLKLLSSQVPDATTIATLKAGLSQIEVGLNNLNTAMQATGADTVLAADLSTIGTNLTKSGTLISEQSSLLTTLKDQVNALSIAQTEKDALISTIGSISAKMTDEAGLISSAGSLLNDGTASDNDVAGRLALMDTNIANFKTAVSTLSSGMTQANAGATQALNGFSLISSALTELITGASKLNIGVSTAYSGSSAILAGLNKLNDNSLSLINGASEISGGAAELTSGSSELATKLTEAASQLELQNTSSEVSDQIAEPITSEKTSQGNVENYGHALAPYVLSLGLFVGALVFNFIYPIRKVFGDLKSGMGWWLAKFSVGFVVAVLQALVMDLIMVKCLGLNPDNMSAFVGVTIVTSLANMSIVMFLAMTFDNPGRFIAMVLLVLQLGGSGGTFPLQLSNGFFNAINPFMPMTYSILGFRQAISAGLGSTVLWQSVGILTAVIIVFNLLILAVLSLRHKREFKPTEV